MVFEDGAAADETGRGVVAPDAAQEAIARSIAELAHAGDVDKSGRAYIEHPAHVASRVEGDEAKAVAWLHDVIEDHGDSWTLDDLRAAGLSEKVVRGVDAMSRRPGEDYLDFVRRAAADPLARQVKLADVVHNMDLSRLPCVRPRDVARIEQKYLPALKILVTGE